MCDVDDRGGASPIARNAISLGYDSWAVVAGSAAYHSGQTRRGHGHRWPIEHRGRVSDRAEDSPDRAAWDLQRLRPGGPCIHKIRRVDVPKYYAEDAIPDPRDVKICSWDAVVAVVDPTTFMVDEAI